MRNDILDKKELILELISKNTTKSEICKVLYCKPSTLERYLKIMNISYMGNQGRTGHKSKLRKSAIYYIDNDIVVGSHKLKLKLIEDNIKEHKCESCGLEEWMGNKIPIELHHVDGNRFNNKLENLEILCPNCHANTDNYSGKNIKHKQHKKKTPKIEKLPIKREVKRNKDKKCECGIEIYKSSNKCYKCYKFSLRKVERPTLEQLNIDIKTLGYTKSGIKYGVSDNCIRKWIKYYEKQ